MKRMPSQRPPARCAAQKCYRKLLPTELSTFSPTSATWRGVAADTRGVRGWATAADVGDATGAYCAGDDLRSAVERGELIREDVSVPDAAAPVWVYHITDETARMLAELEGEKHVPIQPAGTPQGCTRAYLRPGVAVVLDALRHAFDNSTARRARILGEPEWRTCRELTDWVREEAARTGNERSFLSDELAWAVKSGLVERRELPPPLNSSTSAPVVVYRITVTGAAVQPLVWHGSQPVRLPPARSRVQ